MSAVETATLAVRELREEDLQRVVEIDALHTGEAKAPYWKRVFGRFLSEERDVLRVGLAGETDGRVVGYLLGEVRAFEFGSEACGWIFAVGVDPAHLRSGTASTLLAAACRRFRDSGITTVRTMVRRNDVPVLAFFRSSGFTAGSFFQLELSLDGS